MKSIHESVSKLLVKKLEKHKSSKLNKETCSLVYQDIFSSFVELFEGSGIEITNESMNFLSQMYYDAVRINDNQELDPSIFTQRAKLENIPTKELAFLATAMRETPFSEPFILEIKKRS